METEQIIKNLVAVGGSEWQKNGMHRVYFNDLPTLYGLECSRYNTGNVSSATLDGEPISNSQAKRILADLSCAKLWWDASDQKFHGREIEQGYFGSLVAIINEKISTLQMA